ncbi:MAG: hypothetical protein IKW97_00930 [Muribaculaceae bacterium]|nr:hypothetical protein [Muribaculaceae bacterium]
MYSFTSTPSISESIVGVLLLLVVILLPVSWIILLINKKWWQCILSFLSSVIIVVLFWVPLVTAAMFGPDADDFGSKHKIPDGLEYHLPLYSSSDKDVLIDSLNTETYLQIWQGVQGGMYMYDFTILPYLLEKYSCDVLRLLKISLYRKIDCSIEAQYSWMPHAPSLNWLIIKSLPSMKVISKITMLLE